MENININLLNYRKITQIFYFLFIISLFFPIRYIFPNQISYITGVYSDFTSISLYLSDILLSLIFLSLIIPRGRDFLNIFLKNKPFFIFIIFLFLLSLFKIRSNSSLNWYFLFKFIELSVAYGTTLLLWGDSLVKKLSLYTFITLCTFESLLSGYQFFYQKPLGLFKLGELHLSSSTLGFAKVIENGVVYLRGYGTFPHPNLLSAFLVISTLFCVYLLYQSENKLQRLIFSTIFFLNLFGLITTFSRAGFLGFGISLISFGFILLYLYKKLGLGKIIWVSGVVCASILLSFSIFKPFLFSRATISDQSSKDRVFYARTGLKMINNNPILGVGIGESMLHMQQYSPQALQPWDIQPIHNYYLLAATELGVPGMLILLWIYIFHGKELFKKKITTLNTLLFCIMIGIFVLMQFDHYFYTLEQTQLLLWIILGVVAYETKTTPKNEGVDSLTLNI
jgi:O-antigen ligase